MYSENRSNIAPIFSEHPGSAITRIMLNLVNTHQHVALK